MARTTSWPLACLLVLVSLEAAVSSMPKWDSKRLLGKGRLSFTVQALSILTRVKRSAGLGWLGFLVAAMVLREVECTVSDGWNCAARPGMYAVLQNGSPVVAELDPVSGNYTTVFTLPVGSTYGGCGISPNTDQLFCMVSFIW